MTVEPFHAKPKCILCAADLPSGARKCNECGAFQDDRECVSCGSTLPRAASRCANCKTLQEGVPCRACGAMIEQGRRRCSECSEWQTARRFLPASQLTLALVISLISVLTAAVPPVLAYFANRSNTFVRVLGDGTYQPEGASREERTILILAANNGKRPSIVRSASIRFTGIGAAPTELSILNIDQKLILPEHQVLLHLTADRVDRTGGSTRKQILDALDQAQAIVTVVVEETDIRGNFFDAAPPPHHVIDANRIYEWMNRHVSSAN